MFLCQRCRTIFKISKKNVQKEGDEESDLIPLMYTEIFEYTTQKSKIDLPLCEDCCEYYVKQYEKSLSVIFLIKLGFGKGK
jgi:hypothetical protein